MTFRFATLVAATLVSTAGSFAQVAQTAAAPSRAFSMSFGSSGVALAGTPVVSAPYCAKQVSEHTQTLADGTHIVQKQKAILLFRDSQGRTRTERPMGGALGPDGVRIVVIKDPVAGFEYTLDEQGHVAHRVTLTRLPSRTTTNGASGAGMMDRVPPMLMPAPAAPLSAARPGGVGTALVVAPGLVGQTSDVEAYAAARQKATRESLGTEIIEGVRAEGTRTTFVIPVNAQGNDQPITTVHESWMSPDLHAAVLTKSLDPRSGESVTRMTDIVLGEPDPSLFQPPADYTVVDEKGPFNIRYTGR